LEADARDLRAEANSEDMAARSLDITRKQFGAGGVSHVQMLIAEREYAQAHQNRVVAEATRYADSAALYQALGGGWWNRETKVGKQ
jgi:outer membrane protein TolC